MAAIAPFTRPGTSSPASPTLAVPSLVKDRLHGLEWLRAAGAILVVVLHAGIPYQTREMPGLAWCVHPEERSALVNVIGWWIDGFVMPLFILLTGFFAARLLKQRGAKGFLQHRFARLGGPLLFGIVFVLPYDLYAWLLGWVIEERLHPAKLLSLKIPPPLNEGLWGVSHLWFLEYVLSYCVVAWALHGLCARLPISAQGWETVRRRLPRGAGLAALTFGSIFCGMVLWKQPRILLGFRHAWGPQWENWLFYSVPFALGWFWDRGTAVPKAERFNSWSRLLAATILFGLLWPRLDQHLAAETIPCRDIWLPFWFSAFGLLMSTGLFGLARSASLARMSPAAGYVAKASFWIYLSHHPLVGLCQVHLLGWQFSPLVNSLLTTITVLGLCLASYEVLVRRTRLGWLLNGVQEGRTAATVRPAVPVEVERRAA